MHGSVDSNCDVAYDGSGTSLAVFDVRTVAAEPENQLHQLFAPAALVSRSSTLTAEQGRHRTDVPTRHCSDVVLTAPASGRCVMLLANVLATSPGSRFYKEKLHTSSKCQSRRTRCLHASGLWRSLVSALDWGSRGRRFESCQPDHLSLDFYRAFSFSAPDRNASPLPILPRLPGRRLLSQRESARGSYRASRPAL